jgi:3-methylfumaryl-CoA hydratase
VRNVEGHPDLVVHGPLTSTLLVELASKMAQDCGKFLSQFDYRATNPMYVDIPITLKAKENDGRVDMVAEQDGRIGMKATAILS